MSRELVVVIALCLLMGTCAAGESAMQSMSKAKEGLCAAGFRPMCGVEMSTLSRRADPRPGLKQVTKGIETKLASVFAKKWLPDPDTHGLLAVKGHGDDPDMLIQRYKVGDSMVELVVDEFKATISIVPSGKAKPVLAPKDARAVFETRAKSVLELSEKEMKDAFIVKKAATGWLITPSLKDPNDKSKQRALAYTWIESLKVALPEDGAWIAMVLDYHLPRTGMPAGGRARVGGSWFDSELGGSGKKKK